MLKLDEFNVHIRLCTPSLNYIKIRLRVSDYVSSILCQHKINKNVTLSPEEMTTAFLFGPTLQTTPLFSFFSLALRSALKGSMIFAKSLGCFEEISIFCAF